MTVSAVSVSMVFFAAFFPSFVFTHPPPPQDVEGRGGKRGGSGSLSLTSEGLPYLVILDDKECLHLLAG